MEEWKSLVGYEGCYEISSIGRIRGLERQCHINCHGTSANRFVPSIIISQRYDRDGYLRVHLSKNGKRTSELVHRLVAKTFIDNPNNKPQVNHINGRKDDNRVENLEWCTASENVTHAYRTGLCGIIYNSKPVAQLDEEGNILAVFESASKAEKAFKGVCKGSSNILKVCRRGYGHRHGFGWKTISVDE